VIVENTKGRNGVDETETIFTFFLFLRRFQKKETGDKAKKRNTSFQRSNGYEKKNGERERQVDE
jgi:hypothetical protein